MVNENAIQLPATRKGQTALAAACCQRFAGSQRHRPGLCPAFLPDICLLLCCVLDVNEEWLWHTRMFSFLLDSSQIFECVDGHMSFIPQIFSPNLSRKWGAESSLVESFLDVVLFHKVRRRLNTHMCSHTLLLPPHTLAAMATLTVRDVYGGLRRISFGSWTWPRVFWIMSVPFLVLPNLPNFSPHLNEFIDTKSRFAKISWYPYTSHHFPPSNNNVFKERTAMEKKPFLQNMIKI